MLVIKTTVTFDSPKCMEVFDSNRNNPDSYINIAGGNPVTCTSAEEIKEAYLATAFHAEIPGRFIVEVRGELDNDVINESFDNLHDLKYFLEQKGFTDLGLDEDYNTTII